MIIYISTRSLNPPSSGGAFQYTMGIANALSSITELKIIVGTTRANSCMVGKLLQRNINTCELEGLSADAVARSEECLIAAEDVAWCIYPYPSRHDRFSKDANVKYCSILFDLQHMAFPEFFSQAERWKREESYGNAILHADIISTISEFSSREIQKNYPALTKRPIVIYAGASFRDQKPSGHSLRKGNFLLYPANAWAHKNHAMLLKAFPLLKNKYPDLKLVLTGDRKSSPKLFLQNLNHPGVEHLGYVSSEELSLLREHAACVVFPSLYEGFGMPVIEALRVGTPVACSDTTSLPEVGGDAVEYFDPKSPEEIVAAVERAIGNRGNSEWQQKAKEQASKFTFERTARLLVEAMRDVDSVTKSICHQERYQVPGESVLENFWKSYPGVDAILLGAGRSISNGIRSKDFKALNALDTTRLDPQKLATIVTRGVKVSPSSNLLMVNEYKHLLKLVSENKLVVYALSDGEGSVAQRLSRVDAFRTMILQLKYLKRTCRQCVMAVLRGRGVSSENTKLGNEKLGNWRWG